MNYKSENILALDCITAAIGTLLDEEYRAYNFESVIGTEKIYQKICSSFINFAKDQNNAKYVSKENFYEYFLDKKGAEVLEDKESEFIDVMFEQISKNKENGNQGLKNPADLYERLASTRKKIDLKKSIDTLYNTESFKQDAAVWTDNYSEELSETLSEITSSYSESNADNKLLMGEELTKHYSQLLDARESGEVYSFHFPLFDKLFSEGPTPGHGGLIAGATGMGKSTLALNCINALIDADVPTIYFPIEMGVDNSLDRLASMRTHIPFKEIIKIGKAESVQGAREVIEEEMRFLNVHENFAMVNDASIDMKKLESYIRQFQAKLPGRKYCIVFIDLLLLIKEFYDGSEGSMAQMIEKAINKLDILSKKLGCHWVGIVQLNRAVEQDKVVSLQSIDKLKPIRSAIKNSNALLERARYCFTVFRKKAYAEAYLEPEEYESIDDIMEISLLKANDDKMGKIYANYDGPTFTITPVADEIAA